MYKFVNVQMDEIGKKGKEKMRNIKSGKQRNL